LVVARAGAVEATKKPLKLNSTVAVKTDKETFKMRELLCIFLYRYLSRPSARDRLF